MSRPKKVGLDYFPLDVVFDEKIQALETVHGNNGLVWIIKFWQTAYRNENGEVNLSEYFGEVLAKNCRITTEEQSSIITMCLQTGLIEKTGDNIFSSNGVRKRIAAVSSERKSALKRYFRHKEKKIKVKINIKESKVKALPILTAKYNSFDSYKTEELTAYQELLKNENWISAQKKYHPNIDVLLSLEKAHVQFWGTEAGWLHIKKTKSKNKDWKRTYENALSQRINQVWLDRDTKTSQPQKQKLVC